MPKDSGVSCGYCHSGALFMVARETPGAVQQGMYACRSHLAVAAEKAAEAYQAGAVTVYVLGAKHAAIGGGEVGVAEVTEQARRVGAFSGDDERAHSMEDALYLAVLVMIAHGAQNPAGLASAALLTQRYSFERHCA